MKNKKTWTAREREMLFRRAHGKFTRPQYLEKLAQFFATPVQETRLLDLDTTDGIVKASRTVAREKNWISLTPPEYKALIEMHGIDAVRWQPRAMRKILRFVQFFLNTKSCYIYWDHDSHNCGLYHAPVGAKINFDYNFGEYRHRPDMISIFFADGRGQIFLEYCYDEPIYYEETDCFTYISFLECTFQGYEKQ